MPTIASPSIIRSAPMFFSAISVRASNIDAVGTTAWTVGSDFDRRICATFFIGGSRDQRPLHWRANPLSPCGVSDVLDAPSVLRVLLGRACSLRRHPYPLIQIQTGEGRLVPTGAISQVFPLAIAGDSRQHLGAQQRRLGGLATPLPNRLERFPGSSVSPSLGGPSFFHWCWL